MRLIGEADPDDEAELYAQPGLRLTYCLKAICGGSGGTRTSTHAIDACPGLSATGSTWPADVPGLTCRIHMVPKATCSHRVFRPRRVPAGEDVRSLGGFTQPVIVDDVLHTA